MLEVRNLTIRKTAERRTLLANLSFTMNLGDKFAIIGLEGIGKSTLLKAIMNKEDLTYVEIEGSIHKKNVKIGYLPQNLRDLWREETILSFLLTEHPCSEIKPESYAKLALLEKVLRRVQFPLEQLDENRFVQNHSGGEIVKLGIAKMLLDEPDIFLLDEPTNDLDLETILFLEDFILQETKPILFISHDEALLEHTANGIIHLTQTHKNTKAISVYQKLNYREYIESRTQSLNAQEMVARKQRATHERKMERFRQVYQRVEHLQNQAVRNPTQGRLLKKKIHSLKSTEARYQKEKERFLDIPEREEQINLFFDSTISLPNNKQVLLMESEIFRIQDKILLENINLNIKGPEKVALIGKNGVGKTTFLKSVYQRLLQQPSIRVGYMSQDYEELLPANESILSILTSSSSLEEHRIRTLLGALNFTTEEMLYESKDLSGGQKAKCILLKLVLESPNVLLLDEPTRNLSPLSLPVIQLMLKQYKGCIFCVTHDRNFIESVFDSIYELTPKGLIRID